MNYLYMNTKAMGPFSDVNFRKAVAYAMNTPFLAQPCVFRGASGSDWWSGGGGHSGSGEPVVPKLAFEPGMDLQRDQGEGNSEGCRVQVVVERSARIAGGSGLPELQRPYRRAGLDGLHLAG